MHTIRFFAPILLLLLVACAEETRTGVALTIASVQIVEQGLPVDRFAITTQVSQLDPAESSVDLEGRQPTETETINFLFRPLYAGETVSFLVRAMDGDVVQAEDGTEVELVRNKIVDASVLLRSCVAAEGAFCEKDVLVTCDPVSDLTVRTTCDYGCNPDPTGARCNECEPGTVECQGSTFVLCGDDGVAESNEDCTEVAGECKAGRCTLSGCIVTAADDGAACEDASFCTIDSTCTAGVCGGGTPRDCDDQNDCTFDLCDETAGACSNDPVPMNNLGCDDGSFCLIGESCQNGTCTGGTSIDCDDQNDCTTDTCDDGIDQCVNTDKADSTGCDDGDFCTVGTTCTAGTCGGDSSRPCDDSNPCTTDSCDSDLNRCVTTEVGDGTSCDDGLFCTDDTTCQNGACGGGSPHLCDDDNECTHDFCNLVTDSCDTDDSLLDGDPCSTGSFCTLGEACLGGDCLGGYAKSCTDDNPCTDDICNSPGRTCENPAKPDDTPCEDAQFCTLGDTCQGGACIAGSGNPCTDANPCTDDVCDEGNDGCTTTCTAASTSCLDATQLVTCDGACNANQFICPDGCNLGRDECNECTPSATVCRAEVDLLCNAAVTCNANGTIASRSCCSSNQCTCDGTQCLEDLCASSPDLTGGGTLTGSTCTEADNVPGDCNPGGTACHPPASGGAPERHFRFDLDDGTTDSAFYQVVLDSTASALDTTLRVSTVCGSESRQFANAAVCELPARFQPARTCIENDGEAELLTLCGMPEGELFGVVDSAPGTCGDLDLDLSVVAVTPDDVQTAGNITRGGVFTGSTCGLADDFQFFDRQGINGCATAGDCTDDLCPACDTSAAADCSLEPNGGDSLCAYGGTGSPDAVFYLALEVSSGVDISTIGSRFDTVVYVLEAGLDNMTPAGPRRLCNDDCWAADGPSHIQTSLPAGLYFVVLDGAAGACGDYQLNVVVSPAATCPNLSCDAPFEDCFNCPLDCSCPTCGNGTLESGLGESCDDGGTDDGDGCSAVCSVEPGFQCSGEPSSCSRHCGNGVIEPDRYESCDDGNAFGGDGCSAECRLESGFWCRGAPSVCQRGAYAIACPEQVIPDGSNPGITFSLDVTETFTIADINVDVDVTHDWIGDLTLRLSSPTGTDVILHNETGADGQAIQGNYDLDLAVDGPGALSDFHGQASNGTWQLWARDSLDPDSGILHCWALSLSSPAVCPNSACEAPQETCASCPLDCPCQNCGDGAVNRNEGEECDDGATGGGDGCAPDCTTEPGYVCTGEPSTCAREVHTTVCPGVLIPDHQGSTPGVVTNVINVPTSCVATDVNVDVDIEHAWIGDLIVELQSPTQTVRLHNRTGGSASDIVGNYDLSIGPDGPGTMADFDGLQAQGDWTLFISDNERYVDGTLSCWTLNIVCP